jgi:hypothetical protein
MTDADESNAERDEDDGLAKSAAPFWRITGGLIGLVLGLGLFWVLVSRR